MPLCRQTSNRDHEVMEQTAVHYPPFPQSTAVVVGVDGSAQPVPSRVISACVRLIVPWHVLFLRQCAADR